MLREQSLSRSQNSSIQPVVSPASRRSFQPMPSVPNLPYQSPLNPQRRNQQIQQQPQRYVTINQSPRIMASVNHNNNNNRNKNNNNNDNHNDTNENNDNSNNHNHNHSNIQTFQPDPILHPDQDPPPSPCPSSTITQQQHDYIDMLLTDAVVLGENAFNLFDQHHMKKLLNYILPSYEIQGEK